MSDLDDLAALAEAATPGPWSYRSTSNPKMDDSDATHPVWKIEHDLPDGRRNSGPGFIRSDAAYLCAVNPTAVLALIARLRAAEAREHES